MCLGFVRYSVCISRHPCSISIILMCYLSHNSLAPPHFPESPHRMFIPQCIYCPHTVQSVFAIHIVLCVLIYIGLVLVSCFLFGLVCFPCPCPCPVSFVFVLAFYLCLLVFSVLSLLLLLPVFIWSCVLFMFGLPVVFIVTLTFWFWPSFCVLADDCLAFCLCTLIYMITWSKVTSTVSESTNKG